MARIVISGIHNIREFFQAVGGCRGSVELVTLQGDCLNLKSTLCQYIALTQMFEDSHVKDVAIVLSDPEDAKNLKEYLIPA